MYSSPIRQSSYLFTSNINIVEKNSLLQRSAARSVSQFLFIVSENNETLLLDVKVHFSIFLFLSAANYSQEKLMVFAGELMLMRFELALVASFLLKSRLLQSPMQSAHNGKFPSKRIFFFCFMIILILAQIFEIRRECHFFALSASRRARQRSA